MAEVEIGRVEDFFARPVVAGVQLTDALRLGDTIHIHGHTTDITQVVRSMQINQAGVQEATAGQAVGIKVPDRVRVGDRVYKVA